MLLRIPEFSLMPIEPGASTGPGNMVRIFFRRDIGLVLKEDPPGSGTFEVLVSDQSPQEIFRINSSGEFGIGTRAPATNWCLVGSQQ